MFGTDLGVCCYQALAAGLSALLFALSPLPWSLPPSIPFQLHAMSGTDIRTVCGVRSSHTRMVVPKETWVLPWRMQLRACYAMSGTDVGV
eukprot:3346669-Rhodomonas_salina.3